MKHITNIWWKHITYIGLSRFLTLSLMTIITDALCLRPDKLKILSPPQNSFRKSIIIIVIAIIVKSKW
jgi:hypothetical protein